MNAHLHHFDNYQNGRGELLLEFAGSHNLSILNMTEKCSGKYTRIVADQKSVIDYVLCNANALEKFQSMSVDEDQNVVDISDHNLMSVDFAYNILRRNMAKNVVKINHKKVIETATRKLTSQLAAGSIDHKSLVDVIRNATYTNQRTVKVHDRLRCQSKEISRKVKIRKLANLEWRRTRRTGGNVIQAELAYRAAQEGVRSQVTTELAARDRRMCNFVLNAPRNKRSERFWRYVKLKERQLRQLPILKSESGQKVSDADMVSHLTHVTIKILNGLETESQENTLRLSEPTGIQVGTIEVKYLLGRMSSQTATGLDEVPANVLKNLGEIGEEYIARMFNSILEGQHEIPPEWGEGRVSMLEKPNSSKGNLLTYRPITVSTVLYRLFTKTIGSRIQHWIETESILGEMQNGFRTGRRGEDNLFVLTSAIEMSRRQKKGLICAFLDCSQAYDRVNRDRLWEILVAKGMDNKWIELLKLLYTDNNVILKHGQHVSRKAR